jgi:hypothetical protein
MGSSTSQWIIAILGGALATVLGGIVLFWLLPSQQPATSSPKEAEGLLGIYCNPRNSNNCLVQNGSMWIPTVGFCNVGQKRVLAAGACVNTMGIEICPTKCVAKD